MGLSAPWTEYLEIIAFQPVKTYLGMNPIVFSVPWDDSIEIIALHLVKILRGNNPMDLSGPWDDSYLYSWIRPPSIYVPDLKTVL